jgi:mono/diheme cytochrome c family protein
MNRTIPLLDRAARVRALALCVALGALLAPAQLLSAEASAAEGRRLYLRYCASCHGADATGNGPVAAELKTPTPDLTRIRERHGDMWPYLRLRDIIDGRADVRAHGPREMPVWGELIGSEGGDAPGREVAVSTQITVLLAYLKSIQRPAPEAEPPTE